MIFNSPTTGKLSLKRVIQELLCFVNEKKGDYKIIIGTDSSGRNINGKKIDFVTALVIHRIGKGGRYFWSRTAKKNLKTLRQRIYQEATLSLEFAQKLIKNLDPEKTRQNLEIHVDVGKKGETREMIKEVVGMVKGSGFSCKIKPESYAASSVADKHV